MLTPLSSLTVGKLHEHFKYLRKKPSHLTFQKVSKRGLNAGVSRAPGKTRIRGSGGDPAEPDNERLLWEACWCSESIRLAEQACNKQGKLGLMNVELPTTSSGCRARSAGQAAGHLAKQCPRDQGQAPQLSGSAGISTTKRRAAQRQVPHKPAPGKRVKAECWACRSSDPWARCYPTLRSSEISNQWGPPTYRRGLRRS